LTRTGSGLPAGVWHTTINQTPDNLVLDIQFQVCPADVTRQSNADLVVVTDLALRCYHDLSSGARRAESGRGGTHTGGSVKPYVQNRCIHQVSALWCDQEGCMWSWVVSSCCQYQKYVLFTSTITYQEELHSYEREGELAPTPRLRPNKSETTQRKFRQ